MFDLPAGGIEDAGGGDIFIGDVKMGAVGTHGELFRVRAGWDFLKEFFLSQVNDANAVGGVIGVFVIIIVVFAFALNWIPLGIERRWAGYWTAAQGDVKQFPVGAGMDAARSFSHWNGGNDGIV